MLGGAGEGVCGGSVAGSQVTTIMEKVQVEMAYTPARNYCEMNSENLISCN